MAGLLACITEVASSPSIAKAYRMWVPTESPEAAPVKLPATAPGVPLLHGPSNVSNWKYRFVARGTALSLAVN